MLHKKMQCHEYELLPQNHEDTKLKKEFPQKIKRNRYIGVNADLTYPDYITCLL